MPLSLIQKYNVAGPRYTSYPTVPYWEATGFGVDVWRQQMEQADVSEGMSLYIHLPFCESLCTFCGCHKRITTRHEVEQPYIQAVLKEWQLYLELFSKKPLLRELHLGGGTPTFFSPEHLTQLVRGILDTVDIASEHEFGFEGHPNNSSRAHLQALYDLGFRRVSFGVQDYSPTVQKAIHREQSFHDVAKVTFWAREMGYTSISHDLVFGLPFQSLTDITDTIDKTRSLHPDRLAFYSYAHVPWIKGNGQRGFDEADLPQDEVKRQLYEWGKSRLADHHYHEIGMDHFALETDGLFKAYQNGQLHRNFMGYTSAHTRVMIGLGMSAISDSWTAFAQNEKKIEDYYARLGNNQLPVFRGHLLTAEDQVIRRHILNIMCQFHTDWTSAHQRFDELPEVLSALAEMEADGLLEIEGQHLRVTEAGKPFVRNICMAFDRRLQRDQPTTRLFSMTI